MIPCLPMQKQRMERRDMLFATTPSTGSGSGSGPQSTDRLQQLPTERSRDNRADKEIADLLEWVSSFFSCRFSRVVLELFLQHVPAPGEQDSYQVPVPSSLEGSK